MHSMWMGFILCAKIKSCDNECSGVVYQDDRKIIWNIQRTFQFSDFFNSTPAVSEARQILNELFSHFRVRARITI